jgi:hypothetical protein
MIQRYVEPTTALGLISGVILVALIQTTRNAFLREILGKVQNTPAMFVLLQVVS